MSLSNRKNQISFLQVRAKENPAAAQNSDNAADAFKQLNNVLLQYDRRITAVSGTLRITSGTLGTISGSFIQTSQSFSAVSRSVARIEAIPILSGNLVGPVSLSMGTTIVGHSLGRVPNGYLTADMTSPAIIYRTDWSSTNITVSSSISTNAKFWIF
jgi:hypothetical protein